VAEAPGPAGVLLLGFALAATTAGRQFLQRREDPHRGALAGVSLAAALIAGAAAILRLVSAADGAAAALRAAGWRMFLDRPLFGWGVGGFPEIAPLYLSDWHPDALARHPAPGIVELPASLGIIGLLPFAVVLAALLREHYSEEHDYAFTRHLLAGCLGVLLLLPFDNPLLSFGIVFNLLLVFFTALRWTEISRRKPDEAGKKPQLVNPPHTRRIPFYTGPVKELLR
jgi:O-antigen ligase